MTPDDLELLIHRYFERTATPEEESQLWDLLRTRPEAADRFVELSELESGLLETLKAQEELPSGVHRILRRSRRTLRPLRGAASALPWGAVAAAMLLAASLVVLLLRPRESGPGPVVRNPTLSPGAVPNPDLRLSPPLPSPSSSPGTSDKPLPKKDEPGKVPEILPAPTREDRNAVAPRETPRTPPEIEPAPKKDFPPRPPEGPEKPATLDIAKGQNATIERVEGDAARVGDPPGVVFRAAQRISPDQGIETRGPKSLLVLKLDDGTRLELRGETRIEKILAGAGEQKTVIIARGTLLAVVARQSESHPIIFRTPQAETTVLGTKLLFQVSSDVTRLDVEEGRVRLRRISDGQAIEIQAGSFAQAGKGMPLVARFIPILRSFQDGVFPTPDYAGTRDTSISWASPTSNAGGAEQLRVHRSAENHSTALLQWDLTSIPPKSKVLSAELTFWITGSMQGGGARVYEVRRAWEEVEATWRLAATGRGWQIPGALGADDRGTKALASLAPAQPGLTTVPLNDLGVSLVQQWVLAPPSNHGIAVAKEMADAWDLASREWPTIDHRPKLTVTYIPIAK